jgi:hypothetical protein
LPVVRRWFWLVHDVLASPDTVYFKFFEGEEKLLIFSRAN